MVPLDIEANWSLIPLSSQVSWLSQMGQDFKWMPIVHDSNLALVKLRPLTVFAVPNIYCGE